MTKKEVLIMRKTYWTVKTAYRGNGEEELYFKSYENAKAEGEKDFRSLPIKHTVTPKHYEFINDHVEWED